MLPWLLILETVRSVSKCHVLEPNCYLVRGLKFSSIPSEMLSTQRNIGLRDVIKSKRTNNKPAVNEANDEVSQFLEAFL